MASIKPLIEELDEINERLHRMLELTAKAREDFDYLRDAARGLTLHAAEADTQSALLQDIMKIIYVWEETTNSHQDLERALRERLLR